MKKTINHKFAWFILILGIFYYCLDFYFRISPSLIIPQLMQQYQITPLGIGSFASAFYLGYLICQLPAGFLFDIFPVRLTLACSMLLCVFSFLGFAYASEFWLGILLRFFIGATSAFAFIAVLYIARTYLPLHYFSAISGVTIAAGTLAASVGQIMTAVAIKFIAWTTIFFIISGVGLGLAILLIIPGISLPPRLSQNIKSEKFFVKLQQVLKNPVIILNACIGGLFYLPTSILAAVWGITFIQRHYGIEQTYAAMGITALFAGWAIGSPLVGYFAGQMKQSFRAIAFASFTALLLSLIFLYSTKLTAVQINLLLFFMGVCSSFQTLSWDVFHRHCPENLSGLGIALTNTLIMLVAMSGHYLIGFLLSSSAVGITLFSHGLWVIPAAFGGVAVISIAMRI